MEKNSIAIDHLRHSLAHMLASAVLEIFPEAKLGVGPVIENGFYYDFLLPRTLTPEDLKELQKRMRKLIGQRLAFERMEMTTAEAKKFFSAQGGSASGGKERNQPFKVELIEDIEKFGTTKASEILDGGDTPSPPVPLPKGEGGRRPGEGKGEGQKVSLYKTGKFIDLCRGGHVGNTSAIDARAFKLDKIAGAYWRGNEKNPQLQRIYGLAFQSEEELQAHLMMIEEAKKRDHRKLGAELGLFVLAPIVGSGLPIFTPKGTLVRELLQEYLKQEQLKRGYLPVWSPHIGSVELYKTSGHWPYYKDTMYPPVRVDTEEYLLKPMNCPHHIQVYKSQPRSYRDLPIRLSEFGTVYRYEKSGELTGLIRVRALTIDDAHIFSREDQIAQEVASTLDFFLAVLKKLRLTDFKARLSLRDPANKKKYAGADKLWDRAEEDLRVVLKENKLEFFEAKGEAAFYGPKIDFMVRDAIGREWQLGTIQLDYNLPERFELEYTDRDGKKKRPVIIHRAPFGSLERLMGILIEHFAGAFPVWLSPVQVYMAPVGKAHYASARKLGKMLSAEGMRVEVDEARETIPYKVRKAEKQKVPYILVVGDREKSLKKLTVRIRGQEKQPQMSMGAFVKRVKKEIEKKL